MLGERPTSEINDSVGIAEKKSLALALVKRRQKFPL